MNLSMFRTVYAVAALLTIAGAVAAQYVGFYNGPYDGWRRSAYGYGYGYATTPASAYAYGMAAAIRAQGEYNVMNAEAAKRAEEAKRLALENKVKSTETFFEMRRINREQTAAENLARKSKPGDSASRLAASRKARLTVTQLDPVTGMISWPALLEDASFAQHRKQVESLFAARAEGNAVNPAQIQSAIDSLRAALDAAVGSNVTQDYATSVTFLRLLGEEARSLGATQVAAR